ncbi:hypothetical protein C5688_13870 [Methylocystis sp. MitZ-2018]|jgi:hypothetical protein|nr:MAG: hypothetical protein FD148_3095 [Methylocystaceae bacterium]PPD15632.1 MAG: hypothetical protein CTY30_08420 [Methylocystis sp.]PWB89710.1 hypothetical protein C5688_13870 [Methylocystis sp. MitZ-2018]
MGKVIAFQPRTRAASKRREAPERDAQILFFLGVRYVRMEDALVNPQEKPAPESCGAPPGGGKRRRRVRA